MTVTVDDLFCGAGGSSLGAELPNGLFVKREADWRVTVL